MLEFVLNVLGTVLYPACSVIFTAIQLVQSMFYAFAGIGSIYYKGNEITATNKGGKGDTGIIYFLFQEQLVKDMLISIGVLALVLLIVFTVMAFIKNAYSSKPKSWQEIVGNAFKGLANFVFIPVCCMLGVWLGNILLNAINGATSKGGSVYMDRKLFISCAYNANRIRAEEKTEMDAEAIAWVEKLVDNNVIIGTDNEHVQWDPNHDKTDTEYFANVIDRVFSETSVNIHLWSSVGTYYYLFDINYLILLVGGVFMLYVLGSLTFGMIKRMFILLMLFIISPAMCSMYPLDDGKMVGSWKSDFVKQTIGAYSAVAGMNLFFSLLPLIENINLKGGWGGEALGGSLVTLFLTVAGLFVVKDLINMISGYIGGDNAYSSGSSLMKSTTDKVSKHVTKPLTKGVFTAAGAGAAKAKDAEGFGKISSFMGGFAGSALWTQPKEGLIGKDGLVRKVTTALGGLTEEESRKAFKAGEESVGEKKNKTELKKMFITKDDKGKKKKREAKDLSDFEQQKALSLAKKLGIEDEMYSRLAKSKKMSVEDYKENLDLTKNFNKKKKAFDTANAEKSGLSNTITEARNAFNSGDEATMYAKVDDVGRIMGVQNIWDVISKSGMALPEFLHQLQGGVKVDSADMSVDNLMASGLSREESIDRASAFQQFNQMIDKQTEISSDVASAAKDLTEVAKELKKFHAASNATEATFQSSDIDKITTAITDASISGKELTLPSDITAKFAGFENSTAEIVKQVKELTDKFEGLNRAVKAAKKNDDKK